MGRLCGAVGLAATLPGSCPHASGFGWMHENEDLWWHNGAAGGFNSFVAFHRPTRTAVGLLANAALDQARDPVGFRTLRDMTAGKGPTSWRRR